MKKVIIISYFFNPANFVGGERTLSWAKYLNKFGIYPIIITRQWNDGQKDLTDKIEYKEVIHEKHETYEVYRLPYKNSLRDKLAIKNRFKLIQKVLTFKEIILSNFFIKSLSYSNFYFFTKKIIESDNSIKSIIASGRPFRSFFIGYKLKNDFPHIVWVADYRDEWTTHKSKNTNNFLSKIIDYLEKKSELNWTSNVDFFIGVSEAWVNSISKFINKPGIVIKNGYWEYSPINKSVSEDKRLVITYAGSIYSSQNFSIFIKAVKRFINEGNTNILVNFVGTEVNFKENFNIKKEVQGFESYFTFIDRLPKDKLYKLYQKTDLLLLTGYSNVKGCYPVKLFDYYSTGIPLLLCPSDKDVIEDFIKEMDCGFVLNDGNECFELLKDLSHKKNKDIPFFTSNEKDKAHKYTRLYQTELLSKELLLFIEKHTVHSNCLICKSTNLKLLNNYNKSFLIKCEECRFIFSHKKPSQSELITHYDNYTREDYLSPITIKRYNELLDLMDDYRETNNILDMGCGVGYFLEEAKKRGWNVYGTEFTDDAIEICKNKKIKVYKGTLQEVEFDPSYFDIITSFEVIEHINNPREELNIISKILREGGLFYCTTPNFNSISRRYLKQKWNNILYPEHLSYYTVNTLKKVLLTSGLKPIKHLTTGISFSRIQTSKDGKEIGIAVSPESIDEQLRNKFEKNIFYSGLKKIINSLLSLFSLGDTIKIFAIKK